MHRLPALLTAAVLLAAGIAARPGPPAAPAPAPAARPPVGAAATPPWALAASPGVGAGADAVGVVTRWGTLETPGAVAVSLLIRNDGAPDRLVAASSSAAARVELHRTVGHGRDRAMIPVADGIPVPPGLTVLDADGPHPMLVGLRQDLAQGGEFPLRLRFAEAGEVTVGVRIRRRLDAAGLAPIPPVRVGTLELSLAAAPPAPAGEPGDPPAAPATPTEPPTTTDR